MSTTHASLTSWLPQPLRHRLRRAKKSLRSRWKGLRTRLASPRLYQMRSPERIGIVYRVPTEMTVDERLFLYVLIRGVRPERVLEIGSRHGGSAAIIASALEDNGRGCVVGVDPGPDITVKPAYFHGRFQLITRPSPEAIPEARQAAGGPFDVIFIDGLHTRTQCAADLAGALPHAADGAYILFHDALHIGVNEAVRQAIATDSRLHDCGFPCVRPNTSDPLVSYHGLRLLRFSAQATADSSPLIERGYREAGLQPPMPHPDLFDHDGWYCRQGKPCPRCRTLQESALAEPAARA